jgi:hypothetical protein
MQASLSAIDSIMALTLTLLLLSVFCIQIPREAQLNVEARTAYYQKVADQILLSSAMNGYIKNLIDSFELGETPGPILERMLLLCPGRLTCLLEVEDPQGLILCSKGQTPIPPYGISSYFVTSYLGLLKIVCKVGPE